ncbi:N-acetylglucosamine-6-phosphate deacetylase [Anaerosolibacter carboniphilus]|uniref:N-acetylglucosamine-6-phosphate deacetylase n=1 Tax=Anaerosolibacter carboniphilus TaxID=1417629 RepID=A0A841KKH7_9FIRM|nr:N-acetylglucosamine-6-phosphate deacetylase [Anaerosolibacter carboniphilus]MBB6214374.1 N-acetylglucosamine-6-phosphate deacetylase [Anaerosolibacter carboniphilus]
MTKKAIKNGRIILPNAILEGKILLYDEKILGIVDGVDPKEEIEWLDAKGNYISPGFIDIHIHGAYGFDAMDEQEEAIDNISMGICERGVTGYLPATMTMSKERIHTALDNIRSSMGKRGRGARVLGAHMEGPFIHPERKGAHDEAYILKPDYGLIADYLDVIRVITLAPELDDGHKFIHQMQEHPQVVLSIGHSNATFEEAMEAIEMGIRSATHLFNAMTGFHHRNPGVVGAILKSDIFCEAIADNVHIHPAIYSILGKVKGAEKIILITDAMRAACLKNGIYDLGGQTVNVDDHAVRLEDGTLAGSILTMNYAVKNFLENTDYDLPAIIHMASLNPAKLLGLENQKGSLDLGKDADIIIFNKDFEVLTTIVEGQLCFRREKEDADHCC